MNNTIIIKEKSAKCDRENEIEGERDRVGMRTNGERGKTGEVATICGKKASRRKDRKKTIW